MLKCDCVNGKKLTCCIDIKSDKKVGPCAADPRSGLHKMCAVDANQVNL